MWQTMKNAWHLPEVRKKLLYTLLMLLLYRLIGVFTVPGVNAGAVADFVSGNSLLGLLDAFNGGNLSQFTIFAMGISPYITSSIIVQLLTVAIPALERLSKEGGEEGKKKLSQITRYGTILMCVLQGVGILVTMRNADVLVPGYTFFTYIVIMLGLAAGTAISLWIAERITANGIGNGVSMLIFIGIVSRLPVTVVSQIQGIFAGTASIWFALLALIISVLLVAGVTFVTLAERRIPVQYAKKLVGRRMYGGQSTYIPLKVNATGVLPLIFAQSFIMLPGIISAFWPASGFYIWYQSFLRGSWIYMIILTLLILFCAYFYNSISFNPVDISKNLNQNGGLIPGIRQGKPTSDYLARVSSRITLFGAIYLSILALFPTLVTRFTNTASAFGATSILIAVSVAIETSKQLESQVTMRHYKGFL